MKPSECDLALKLIKKVPYAYEAGAITADEVVGVLASHRTDFYRMDIAWYELYDELVSNLIAIMQRMEASRANQQMGHGHLDNDDLYNKLRFDLTVQLIAALVEHPKYKEPRLP